MQRPHWFITKGPTFSQRSSFCKMIVKNTIWKKKKKNPKILNVKTFQEIKKPYLSLLTASPILQVNMYATKKSGSVTFIPFPFPNLMEQYQKKTNSQSWNRCVMNITTYIGRAIMIATTFRYHHYECFAPRSTQLKINDEPDRTLGQKCPCFLDASPP